MNLGINSQVKTKKAQWMDKVMRAIQHWKLNAVKRNTEEHSRGDGHGIENLDKSIRQPKGKADW